MGECRGRPARSGRGQDQADGGRLNFIDIYHGPDFYPQPSLPFIPGMEGAGVITAVGAGVTDLKVGAASPMPGRSAPMPRSG